MTKKNKHWCGPSSGGPPKTPTKTVGISTPNCWIMKKLTVNTRRKIDLLMGKTVRVKNWKVSLPGREGRELDRYPQFDNLRRPMSPDLTNQRCIHLTGPEGQQVWRGSFDLEGPQDGLPQYLLDCLKEIAVPMNLHIEVPVALTENSLTHDCYTVLMSDGSLIGAGKELHHPSSGFFQHCGETDSPVDWFKNWRSQRDERVIEFEEAKDMYLFEYLWKLYGENTGFEGYTELSRRAWMY